MRNDIPKSSKVLKVKKHSDSIFTLYLEGSLNIKPGQFIMLWLPGVDEKPFTVSELNENNFGVSIKAIGECTKALYNVKEGDILGYRGPYGRPFFVTENKNVCIVGGGIGMAELTLLYHELNKNNNKVYVIYGARTGKELVFEHFEDAMICTDDGCKGIKGFTTDLLNDLLKKEKIDMVYTCGPEIMMKKVVEICKKNNINCEVSLERYMKCGFGVCGNCAINGLLVCKNGTIFNSKQLDKMPDFGNYGMDKTGSKVKL